MTQFSIKENIYTPLFLNETEKSSLKTLGSHSKNNANKKKLKLKFMFLKNLTIVVRYRNNTNSPPK